jgi:hypothetical protein
MNQTVNLFLNISLEVSKQRNLTVTLPGNTRFNCFKK